MQKTDSWDSRGDSLLDEIEARMEHNWKMAVLNNNKGASTLTEKQQRDFREQEYKDYELMEQSKSRLLTEKSLNLNWPRRNLFRGRTDAGNSYSTRRTLLPRGCASGSSSTANETCSTSKTSKVCLLTCNSEIRKLKDCFRSLDDDESGSIGV